MSNPQSIIVNCGATQVSVAVFTRASGRLVLERLVVEDLDYDYTGEETWLAALSTSLGRIVTEAKLSGSASVIIPGYQLLTKNIRVPQVERDKQRQIIGFEAQKQIPYPLAEVVWDSQIISSDGIEADVMLFALKHDLAERIARVVSVAGLTPTVLEASTILDYQAWRGANPGDTDDVLIVNIGARTTNLTFVNGAGFSVHNINVGGNLLTQAIADSIAQPFRTAENLKIAHFSGKRNLSGADRHTEDLRLHAQAFMRRISQEITKRIVIYRRQNKDGQPKKIILAGRASLLPGLSEFLCESQRISVDYFDPFPAFDIAPGVDAEFVGACRVRLAEIIGEAVRGSLPGSVGVNLIPSVMEEEIAFRKVRPLLVAAAAFVAIAPWPAYLHFKNETARTVGEGRALENRRVELAGCTDAIAANHAEAEKVAVRVKELHEAVAARENWRDFMADLQKRVSGVKDSWIEEFRFARSVGAEGSVDAPSARVVLTFGMLLKAVPPEGAFNAGAFNARRAEIMKALAGCPYVAGLAEGGEKSDFSRPNLPRLTLTLNIRQDQKPL